MTAAEKYKTIMFLVRELAAPFKEARELAELLAAHRVSLQAWLVDFATITAAEESAAFARAQLPLIH